MRSPWMVGSSSGVGKEDMHFLLRLCDPTLRVYVHMNRTSVAFFILWSSRLEAFKSWPFSASSGVLGVHGGIQLCVKHKSWKLSVGLFLDPFHLKNTSRENFDNQKLIRFHQVNPWFDHFTLDWGNFLRHFLLVKPLVSAAHLTSFYLTSDSPCLCQSLYPKYWSKIHFNQDTHFYSTKLGFISPDEVAMKEEYDLGSKDLVTRKDLSLSRFLAPRRGKHELTLTPL